MRPREATGPSPALCRRHVPASLPRSRRSAPADASRTSISPGQSAGLPSCPSSAPGKFVWRRYWLAGQVDFGLFGVRGDEIVDDLVRLLRSLIGRIDLGLWLVRAWAGVSSVRYCGSSAMRIRPGSGPCRDCPGPACRGLELAPTSPGTPWMTLASPAVKGHRLHVCGLRVLGSALSNSSITSIAGAYCLLSSNNSPSRRRGASHRPQPPPMLGGRDRSPVARARTWSKQGRRFRRSAAGPWRR